MARKNIHILCQGRRAVIESATHFDTFEWNLSLADAKNIEEVSLHEKQKEPEYLRGRVERVLLNPETGRVVFSCVKLDNRPDIVSNWSRWKAYTLTSEPSDASDLEYDGQET